MPRHSYLSAAVLTLGLAGADLATIPTIQRPHPAAPGSDTPRTRSGAMLPACPMPVFRPPSTARPLERLPRSDAPRLDTLRAALVPRPTLSLMPIIRSGCVNPLDTLADRQPQTQSSPSWRPY
jgi:hypothetical protein